MQAANGLADAATFCNALENRNPPMNRSIVMFVALFVGVFGSAYLMMEGSPGPANSPSTGPVAKSADSGVSQAKDDEGKSASATAASDSKTMKDEANSSSAKSEGGATTQNKDREKSVQKVAAAPRAADLSRGASNKGKLVYRRPAATEQTAEPAESDDDESDDDLEQFWGTWRLVGYEFNGLTNSAEDKKYSWDFQLHQYTIKQNGDFAQLWTVRLNSRKKPRTIDGTNKLTGQKLMGIYEFKGDTLKICYDLTGRGRPDSFKTTMGSWRACYIFQR
jgi:uncharacterized protein (TIGR03067 family)